MIVNDYNVYLISFKVRDWGLSYGRRKSVNVLSTSPERAEELIADKYRGSIEFICCSRDHGIDMVDSAVSLDAFSSFSTYFSAQVVVTYTLFNTFREVVDYDSQGFRVVYECNSNLTDVLNETFTHIGKGIVEVYNSTKGCNELMSMDWKVERNNILDIIDPNISLEIFNQ